jgi:hypothetical protein
VLSRRIRWIVVAAAVLSVAGGASSRAAEEPPSFSQYSLRASATGVSVLYEIKGLLPIDQLVEGASLFSESQVGPSWSTSLAAAPYPGSTALAAPGTADGFAGTDLPDYPMAARAESPVTPHDDRSAGAATIVADAEPGRATATAGSGAAETGVHARTEVLAADGLRAHGESSSQQLVLADGALSVGSVRSVVSVEVRGGEIAITENRTVVSDVAVLGTPVVVGNDGAIVADQPIDLSGADPAAAALEQAGVRLRVVAPEIVERDHGISVVSGALVVESIGDVQGRPSRFRVVHGGVRVDVDATPAARAPLPVVVLPHATDAAPPVASVTASAVPVAHAPAVSPPRSTPAAARAAPIAVMPAAAIAAPIDFRPVYPWLVALGVAALALQRWLSAARRRPASSDLRQLWRW